MIKVYGMLIISEIAKITQMFMVIMEVFLIINL